MIEHNTDYGDCADDLEKEIGRKDKHLHLIQSPDKNSKLYHHKQNRNQKPSNIRCKQCGGYMVEKGKKLVCADKECGFVMDKEEVK